jgi:hypothetical protein
MGQNANVVTDLRKIVENITLAFFKLSIYAGLLIYYIIDGIVDEFEDESGLGSKINTTYDAINNLYSIKNTLLDYFEYLNNGAAQAAYVTNAAAIVSRYPPAHSNTYVKATSIVNANYQPYFATNPALSLTGVASLNAWLSASGSYTNQRFHIDLGSAKIITKIYYENYHSSGAGTDYGVKNFTLWGSNSPTAFAELAYGIDTDWTQIVGLSQSTFDQHTGSDVANPKYITVTNSIAYRYYALKFANNYEAVPANFMGFRRIVLQTTTPDLQSYSEAIIKAQGAYSLKIVATADALNKTLTRTIGTPLNLTGQTQLTFKIYALRTGQNIKVGFHDAGGVTTEITPDVLVSNTWQTVTVDLSGVADANKDAIDSIIITIVNADADNVAYIDDMITPISMTLISVATAASSVPSTARIIILEEDVDSIVLNTDLIAYASRDNGATWTALPLSDEGFYLTGKRILSSNAVSIAAQPSGSNMKYRLDVANNKNFKIKGVSLQWA